MKRLLTLLMLIACCPGCAAMEDLILGPEPYPAGYWVGEQTVNQGCNGPPPASTMTQSPEPPLLPR